MSNRTWVCFACRKALRRGADSVPAERPPVCPECAAPCAYLGYKIRVPRRSDHRAWDALHEGWCASRIERERAADVERVRTRHALEKEIAALRSLPEHPERMRQIRLLQQRLDEL